MKSKTFKTPERINERIIMLFEGKEYYLRKCVKITDWAGCCPSLPSLSLCWGLGIWGDCAPEKAVWSSSHQSGLPDESLTWSLRTGGHFRRGHFSSDSLNTWQHLLSVSLSHRLQLPPAPARPLPRLQEEWLRFPSSLPGVIAAPWPWRLLFLLLVSPKPWTHPCKLFPSVLISSASRVFFGDPSW